MHEQQTVVTDIGPAQPVHFSQPYQTTSVINSYHHRQSTLIGALLVIAGSLNVIFSIAEIAVAAHDLPYSRSVGTANGVGGVVCGVLIVTAGGFGIGAGRVKSRCMITTFLVLAIVGAIFTGSQVVRASVIAWIVVAEESVFIMSVMLALIGACEFALCLWGSILCCATGGCCRSQPVAYMMMPAGDSVAMTVMAQRPADQHQVDLPTPPQYPGYDSK